MYKFLLKKHIHSGFSAFSSKDIYLEKEFELPFVPFIGLNISSPGKEYTEFYSIKELQWDTEKQIFIGYDDEDKEIYEAKLHRQEHRPIEEIVNEYIEQGWKKEIK